MRNWPHKRADTPLNRLRPRQAGQRTIKSWKGLYFPLSKRKSLTKCVLMWIPFERLTNTPKTELQFYALPCPACHQSFGLLRLLLRICHCTACHCPAIIEYHQGSIPAPSYTPGALHDKLRQVIHSLLSNAMNCFTVISPQGRGIMSNLLPLCARGILYLKRRWPVLVLYLYTCRSEFRQYLGSLRSTPSRFTAVAGWHWRKHVRDMTRLDGFHAGKTKQSVNIDRVCYCMSWTTACSSQHNYSSNTSTNLLPLLGLVFGYWGG